LPESRKVNAKPKQGAGARFFLKARGLQATTSRLFFKMTQRNAQASKLLPGKHCRNGDLFRFTFA